MESMENNNIVSPENTSEKSPMTEELLEEIRNKAELADFNSGVQMAEDYIKIGAMEFLGYMTKKAMEEFADNEEIRVEPIPEQLRNESGAECKVYKIIKKYDPKSPVEQKIMQEQIEREEAIKQDTARQYETLAQEGKLKPLGILSREKIEEYKKKKEVKDEHIVNVICFDENNEMINGTHRYYEVVQ